MAGNFQIHQNSLRGVGEDTFSSGLATRLGMQVVADFYTYMALVGGAYQVRAGTISVPLVGDVLITDTFAEMSVDAASGLTIIPVAANISFNLAAATLFETAGKSVATVSSAGTAFTPLPLRSNGAASTATARVAAAGGVTVTAELATTTLRHFSWGHPIAAGAWPTIYDWSPRVPPILVGARCFYIQIAADTTGPSYFASCEFIEAASATLL